VSCHEQCFARIGDDENYDFIGGKDTKYNGMFFVAVKTTGIW